MNFNIALLVGFIAGVYSSIYISNQIWLMLEIKKNKKPKKEKKPTMSFFTAFKLSFRNLYSKLKRTALVCVAGSIGIVGVSTVLAVSSGIHGYIESMQDDMLSGNPITITETTYDINAMMGSMTDLEQTEIVLKNGIVSINSILENLAKRAETMKSIMVSNEISQEYIDYLKAMPEEYLEALSFNYGIDISNNIYTNFYENNSTTPKNTSLSVIKTIYSSMLKETNYGEMSSMIASLQQVMSQSLSNEEYLLSQYDLLSGEVANEKHEIMIVVNKDRQLTDLTLAQLGYYSQEEFLNILCSLESYSNHPIAISISKLEHIKIEFTNIMELAGFGIKGQYNGKTIIAGNEQLMKEHNIEITKLEEIGSVVYLAVDGEFKGSILVCDEIKTESKEMIKTLKSLNINPIILTGDNKDAARNVASKLEIDKVHAKLLPDEKLTILEKIIYNKEPNTTVVYVGDGINDAPSIKLADVGVAIGGLGNSEVVEISDVVLMSNNINSLVNALKISKFTKKILKFYRFLPS